jgi:8-oxo-dGTP pyrophosphatase MutT (NUDIX family)/heme-degrading monooxygenase HmoA
MTNDDVVQETAAPEAAGAGATGRVEGRMIGAVSVFIFRGDRLLALKRSARSDAAPGAWDAVSGRLRDSEHPRDAAVREAREETGLEVLPDESPVVAYSATRGDAPMLVVAYSAESAPGEVALSAEHDEWAWMTIDEFARACSFPLLVDAARRAAARRTPSDPGHVILWEFRVKPGCEAAFEAAYGSEGDWARLFRRDPGFRGTELLRVATARGYLTIDRWVSRAAFESFQKRHRKEYEALDRMLSKLTERETPLGSLTGVPPAPGAAARAALETRRPAAAVPEAPVQPAPAAGVETSTDVTEAPAATDGPPVEEG